MAEKRRKKTKYTGRRLKEARRARKQRAMQERREWKAKMMKGVKNGEKEE
jgi:hypothetical protein